MTPQPAVAAPPVRVRPIDYKRVRRALADREWRLDHLYHIQDANGRQIRFIRNAAQRRFWSGLWYLNICLKARQLGFSTFIAIVILDACLFNSNTAAGVIDSNIDEAKKKLEKIRFAYKTLPLELQREIPLSADNALSLAWANGSSVSVSTSHRGGTLQLLHVSEYGKIAVERPQASKEIRSGAFGTVHRGNFIFVESTARGAGGDFHELVTEAEQLEASGKRLAQSQFKLHFFAWWQHPDYVEEPARAVIDKELADYFGELEAKHGIKLSARQKAWYALKRRQIGIDEMYREYPSYAEEAFKVSREGAYFKTQMMRLREQGRIGRVPLDPSRPVHTCWDIGKDDNTAIWFFQAHGQLIHHVDYYENSGEGTEHYARYCKRLALERGFLYGTHYGPHDLDNSLWVLPGSKTVKDVAGELGIDFQVVPRIPNKMDAIEAARNWLSLCWIDEERCALGIRRLDNYHKEWDDKRGHYKSEPVHDENSHGADALMTGACGFTPDYVPPPVDRYKSKKPQRSAWAA